MRLKPAGQLQNELVSVHTHTHTPDPNPSFIISPSGLRAPLWNGADTILPPGDSLVLSHELGSKAILGTAGSIDTTTCTASA